MSGFTTVHLVHLVHAILVAEEGKTDIPGQRRAKTERSGYVRKYPSLWSFDNTIAEIIGISWIFLAISRHVHPKTDKGADMVLFPYTVGQTVDETTFMAIATSWEYPTCQIILTKSDMSEYTTIWHDTTDGSIFNVTKHATSEDAMIKFVQDGFNFSI